MVNIQLSLMKYLAGIIDSIGIFELCYQDGYYPKLTIGKEVIEKDKVYEVIDDLLINKSKADFLKNKARKYFCDESLFNIVDKPKVKILENLEYFAGVIDATGEFSDCAIKIDFDRWELDWDGTFDADSIQSILIPLVGFLKEKKWQAIFLYYKLQGKEEKIPNTFSYLAYQNLSSFTATYSPDKTFDYLTIALAGEVGELCNKWKKILRGDSELTEEVASGMFYEVSDVCWYAANICRELKKRFPHKDFDYKDVHLANVAKLFDRHIRNKIAGNGDNR